VTPQIDTPYYWSHVDLDPLFVFTEETSRGSIPYTYIPSEQITSIGQTTTDESAATQLQNLITSVRNQIQSLQVQIEAAEREQGITPYTPPASTRQILNTLPPRQQLGDITESLRGAFEWLTYNLY